MLATSLFCNVMIGVVVFLLFARLPCALWWVGRIYVIGEISVRVLVLCRSFLLCRRTLSTETCRRLALRRLEWISKRLCCDIGSIRCLEEKVS